MSARSDHGKHHHYLDTIDECLTNAVKHGIFHLNTEDQALDGRHVQINGQKLINFGSCSYMGLEVDPRVKQGAIDATMRFGTQYSSSRAYVSCGLYVELERLFTEIFQAPVVVAPSTSLAHMATIPVVIRDEDAIILDHQVHASVHNAVQLVRPRGVRVEMIRHNRLDLLEAQIQTLRSKHRNIWYMVDGIYSMYGDCAPMKALESLMNRYEQFRLYVDDAHGMSWSGPRGCGYALNEIALHRNMILVTSMAKGFGTGGGVIVVPTEEQRRRIRTCGSTIIFSGPIQPPMLGAAIASAQIHLSPQMPALQQELMTRIDHCNEMMKKHQLPLVAVTDTPLFFVGAGLPRVGYNLIHRMMDEGFYINVGIFPAVPVKCTGVRITLTRNQTLEDIEQMTQALAHHYPLAFHEERRSFEDIRQFFQIPVALKPHDESESHQKEALLPFYWEHFTAIHEVSRTEWDELLASRGIFDHNALSFFEKSMQGHAEIENNWKFHYCIIRDRNTRKPILATFLCELWSKDDMLSHGQISKKLEKIRKEEKNSYLHSSKVLMTGCLMTEGRHVYVDEANPHWREAFAFFLDKAREIQKNADASILFIRDFGVQDRVTCEFLADQGFAKVNMMDMFYMEGALFNSNKEFLSKLSYKERHHQRHFVLKYEHCYDVRIIHDTPDDVTMARYYELYKNVKARAFDLNTFDLPPRFFKEMADSPHWEIIELTLKPEFDHLNKHQPIAVVFCYRSEKIYCPLIIGIDYDYLHSHAVYRQSLFQLVKRANEIKAPETHFGMGAAMEKKRFGLKALSMVGYVQADDNFSMDVIELMSRNNDS